MTTMTTSVANTKPSGAGEVSFVLFRLSWLSWLSSPYSRAGFMMTTPDDNGTEGRHRPISGPVA
jgi:hypothetical protein